MEFYKRGEYIDFIDEPPQVPDVFDDIWGYFLDLNNSRVADNAITISDIYAYFKVIGVTIGHFELGILQDLDNQYLHVSHAKNVDEL